MCKRETFKRVAIIRNFMKIRKYGKEIYIDKLNELSDHFESVPNTLMSMYFKVLNLIALNMRYEKIAFNKELNEHPFILVKKLIEEQIQAFKTFKDILFIENQANGDIKSIIENMEEKHYKIWNALWNKYDEKSYEEKVDRYKHRIKINNLTGLIKDKCCLDLGCGNGTFSVALTELGAKKVSGIDLTENSIEFAKKMLETRKSKDKIKYSVASIYKTPFDDGSFDFVVQNGVFHHLDNESKAIDEAKRVLKKRDISGTILMVRRE